MHARGDRVGLTGRLEPVEQRRRIGHHHEPLRAEQRRLIARPEQRLERRLTALVGRERASGHHVHDLQPARHDVVVGHAVVAQSEHGQVRHRWIALAHRHGHRMRRIADDLLPVVIDAPGSEQRTEIGAAVGAKPAHRATLTLVHLGHGIDEHEQLAAAQHELIDGVQRVVGRFFGCTTHQHVDVIVDRGQRSRARRCARRRAAQLLHDRPGLAHLPRRGSKRRMIGRVDIRPTTGFFGCDSSWISLAMSYSRNSSLSGSRNGMISLAVGRVGAGETEVDVARRSGRRAPPAGRSRSARSSSSENGCGSIDLELELAVGTRAPSPRAARARAGVGAQPPAPVARPSRRRRSRGSSARRVGRGCSACPATIVYSLFCGQVEARAAQAARCQHRDTATNSTASSERVRRRRESFLRRVVMACASVGFLEVEHDRRWHEPDTRSAAEVHEVAQVDHALGDRVEVREEAESEAIASTSACGAQPRKKSSTSGKPGQQEQRNRRPTVRMKAMTWLRVTAERHAPIARKPPAISRLPR